MKKIKIACATVAQLNWLVAKALGAEFGKDASGAIAATLAKPITFLGTLTTVVKIEGVLTVIPGGTFSPTTRPEQGSPIIERLGISTRHLIGWKGWGKWEAKDSRERFQVFGETLLMAAMRLQVVSALGHEAEVPEELA